MTLSSTTIALLYHLLISIGKADAESAQTAIQAH